MKKIMIQYCTLLFIGLMFVACQNEEKASKNDVQQVDPFEVPVANTGTAVATNDQFGDPLYEIKLDSTFVADKDTLLQKAIEEIENGNPDKGARTMMGRRYMELARYDEALEVFTENINNNPGSLADHRFRGECYYYLQNFDAALSDLETAKELSKQLPNQIEYEVDATSANMPVYNQAFNTFYYLALTHYVTGDMEQAVRSFGYAWNNAANDDLRSMLACWIAICYRKQSMEGQAKAVLQDVTPEMQTIQSPVYKDMAMMFKGYMSTDGMLEKYKDLSIQDFQISRFGVGMWYLLDKQPDKAKPLFEEIIETKLWNTDIYPVTQFELNKL